MLIWFDNISIKLDFLTAKQIKTKYQIYNIHKKEITDLNDFIEQKGAQPIWSVKPNKTD